MRSRLLFFKSPIQYLYKVEIVFIVHAVSTLFMTSICWFVQLVHYPLFREINLSDFPKYERKNSITAYITVPTMIVEYSSGLYLLYVYQDVMQLSNVLLMGVIAASTIWFQVPIHLKLMKEAQPELINKLIHTNWIRTISWSIRAAIIIYLIYSFISPHALS